MDTETRARLASDAATKAYGELLLSAHSLATGHLEQAFRLLDDVIAQAEAMEAAFPLKPDGNDEPEPQIVRAREAVQRAHDARWILDSHRRRRPS